MADIRAELAEVLEKFVAAHPELSGAAEEAVAAAEKPVTGFYDLVRRLVKAALPPMSGPEQEAAEQAIAAHQAEHEQLADRAGVTAGPADPAPPTAPVTQE
jgi:hypothetical protein